MAVPDAGEGGGSAFGTPAPAARSERRARKSRQAAARRRAARRRAARRKARRPNRAPDPGSRATPAPPAGAHVFPIAGAYDLGGEDAAFGAPRGSRRHTGYDVAAALDTPVVAPYAGEIEWVRFQPAGAGQYVVLDADDGHDYVFMHMRRGSSPVPEGARVAAGDTLGQVGNSGRSFGAHLHFEVWTGGWYEKGGEPVDPLPFLLDWTTR